MSNSEASHCTTGSGRLLRTRRPAGFALVGIVLAGLLSYFALQQGVAAGRPAVTIDDDGQVAGAPIVIRGSGFGVGESVILTTTHAEGTAEPGMGHESWTVIAQDGTFSTMWAISPADVESHRFIVRSVGSLSGPANAVSFGRMAFVNTDLFDYAPGEMAAIVGGGFRAGEAVTLQVLHTRGGNDGGAGHDPWTVNADASGSIATAWYVDPDDSLGAEFLLRARGEGSGLAASWAFMDAVCVNPPPPDPVVPLAMPGVTCPTNLNSCTANDVVTTVVAATPVGGDTCGSATDTLTLDFTIQFATTANQRYDLGFYVAGDGNSIPGHTAQVCAGSAPQAGDGDANADPADCDSDRFLNLDPTGHKVGDPDTCGDLQNNAGPVRMTFRATVACDHLDINHNLLVPSCRVWEQNANHDTACTGLAQAGTGSKCDCTDLSFAGVLDPCITAYCDDGNDCTANTCDSSSGRAVCGNPPVANGTSCDDGTACTVSDTCQGGVCTPGSSPSCDDGNPCTDDSCDSGSGCTHVNNNAPCGNDVFCDGADVCSGGACTHPGDPCTATGDFCDEAHDRCNDCRNNSDCGPGAPYCKPETGTCTECGGDTDCHDPSKPYCDTGNNTCLGCLNDAQCDNGNVCDGGEFCSGSVCHSGTLLGCDDGNPCTADSCNPGSGCTHADVGDAEDGSCESVTDTMYCPLPDDTFRLINLQNPTAGTSGTIVQNDYLLNASNPGQWYYNVFYSGTPGSSFNLQIAIPWPFVTNGANPIQVHDGSGPASVTLGDGRCFVPSDALAGYSITTDGGHTSTSGYPVILRSDYTTQNLGSTSRVYVSGSVPSTGLAYVTIHLDYGLKKTTGWQQAIDLTTLLGPDTNLDGTPDGFGSGPVSVKGGTPANVNGQDYTFSASFGPTLSSRVYSTNTFKKNPGVSGMTVTTNGKPKAGVVVRLLGSAGNLIASASTDQDGFYQIKYKHTGKAATFTVALPGYNQVQTITLKANGSALVLFDNVPELNGARLTIDPVNNTPGAMSP